ncbi:MULTISPECIES: hypothetical protein [unclassified Methanoregula]|uniref:hypothetical protein n=1 Tax=unclassified Methanoregula TaxID=2649730 RepID=UPI0009C68402|nr:MULTISPECIES: hypothetical protein [unclassified Methanoregula]OPX64732.1 MAG: hypothetical protein A4E33_00702 [Methanoregula sp. PtaB.Bin085]OPY35202.1 MAG: hypothetical protein A4E34_00879 [Methanoregula sp. PtaU1.Bin006]
MSVIEDPPKVPEKYKGLLHGRLCAPRVGHYPPPVCIEEECSSFETCLFSLVQSLFALNEEEEDKHPEETPEIRGQEIGQRRGLVFGSTFRDPCGRGET